MDSQLMLFSSCVARVSPSATQSKSREIAEKKGKGFVMKASMATSAVTNLSGFIFEVICTNDL